MGRARGFDGASNMLLCLSVALRSVHTLHIVLGRIADGMEKLASALCDMLGYRLLHVIK